MIYLYYLVIAVGGALPAAIPLAFAGAVFVQQTSPFRLNRPLGSRRKPTPESHQPKNDTVERSGRLDSRLRYWHVAAAAIMVGTPIAAFASHWVSANQFAGCVPNMLYGCVISGALTEVMLALLLASIPFALFYLAALLRCNMADAALIALAVWAVPRALLLTTPQWAGHTDPAVMATSAVATLAVPFVSVLRPGRARTVVIASGCAVMLFGLVAATVSEPIILIVDGILSATAFGYGIYLIERKRARGSYMRPIARPQRAYLEVAVTAIMVVLVAATVVQKFVIAAGNSEVIPQDISEIAWVSLIILGCIGAAGLGITTLTRRLLELRPFLTGLTWPAMLILATGTGIAGLDAPELYQLALGTVFTAFVMWAMWYVFGPGRERHERLRIEAGLGHEV